MVVVPLFSLVWYNTEGERYDLSFVVVPLFSLVWYNDKTTSK